MDGTELSRWQTLIEDACDYVQTRCKVDAPDSAQTARLEKLAAAYALKLYCVLGDPAFSQFVAGDVRLTLPADGQSRGEALWNELSRQNADLIHIDGFLFGRVM